MNLMNYLKMKKVIMEKWKKRNFKDHPLFNEFFKNDFSTCIKNNTSMEKMIF